MKSELPKGLAIGVVVLCLIAALVWGGMSVNRASGPEIDRSQPPADFLDPSKAKQPAPGH